METTVISQTPAAKLGQRLRNARLARNMTQGEVARGMFSVSYVSAVERGQIRPSLSALERLAERLQAPLKDLLGDEDLSSFTTPTSAAQAHQTREGLREEIESRLREATLLLRQSRANDGVALLGRMRERDLSMREAASLALTYAQLYLALGQTDEARRQAQEGLASAEKLNDIDLSSRLRLALGAAYLQAHNDERALETLQQCLAALDQSAERDGARNPELLLDALTNLGALCARLGNQEQALAYLRRAAEAAAEATTPDRLAADYARLSEVFRAQGNTTQARLYALRSVAAFDYAATQRLTTQVYTRLGRAYTQSGQIEEALTQLDAAYALATAQHDRRGVAEAQRARAAVYLQQNDAQRAIQAAEEALASAEATDDPRQRAEALLIEAQAQERQDAYAAAEQSFEQALDLIKTLDDPALLRTAYEQFSEYLERRGENQRAFEMLKSAYRSTGRLGGEF